MGRELESLSLGRRARGSGRIEVVDAGGERERYTRAPRRSRRRRCANWSTSIAPRPSRGCMRDELRYRDFLTVALMVDKPDLFPDNWIYIHDPSVQVGRVQNFRSWSPEMVPAA